MDQPRIPRVDRPIQMIEGGVAVAGVGMNDGEVQRRSTAPWLRRRHRHKRGGDVVMVALDEAPDIGHDKGADLVALSDALTALASFDARMSQVVELRFFGGLSVEDTADVLHVSPETVMRDWKTAKVWSLRELSQGNPEDGRADRC